MLHTNIHEKHLEQYTLMQPQIYGQILISLAVQLRDIRVYAIYEVCSKNTLNFQILRWYTRLEYMFTVSAIYSIFILFVS